ncbi:MAG: hypothetical protein ACSLFD_04815, partial [Solirubrobacterales bacterium]
PHPCRHCSSQVMLNEQFLFERERPWLVLHLDCVLSLGQALVRSQMELEGLLIESDDGLTVELLTQWHVVKEFIRGFRAALDEVEDRRENLEFLILHGRPELMDRASPPVRKRRPQRRG